MKTPQPKDWQEEIIKSIWDKEDPDYYRWNPQFIPILMRKAVRQVLRKILPQATQDAVEAERARLESLIPEKAKLDELQSSPYYEGWNLAISIIKEAVKTNDNQIL